MSLGALGLEGTSSRLVLACSVLVLICFLYDTRTLLYIRITPESSVFFFVCMNYIVKQMNFRDCIRSILN